MSMELIKKLRDATGAGINDCKQFLEESNGDFDAALELARKKGQKVAAKRQEKEASEGIVHSYIHSNNKVGVLIMLKCETDFVARNEAFSELAHELSIHIAAMSPMYVDRSEVTAEMIENEKRIQLETLRAEGKPENMIEKIVEGKMNKFYSEICLMDQLFVKDDSKNITQLIEEYTLKLGEKIAVAKFVRYSF